MKHFDYAAGESDEEEVQLVAERGPVELVAEKDKFGHVTHTGRQPTLFFFITSV